MKNDLNIYKRKLVIVIYHENPNSKALTLKGYCFETSNEFIYLKSGGGIVTSIKKEWIRKIKTKEGDTNG